MSYHSRSSGVGGVGSRRSPRPNSFSGTSSSTPSSRLRSAYPSAAGSPSISGAYGIYGSGASASPSSWSSSAAGAYPSSLTTYGGTNSGYGGLTLPNPNTFPSHGLSAYFGNYGGRSSSPSSPSYLSSRTSFGLSPFSSATSGIGSSQYTSPYTPSAQISSRTSDIPYVSSRPLSTASSLSGSAKSVASEGYAVM